MGVQFGKENIFFLSPPLFFFSIIKKKADKQIYFSFKGSREIFKFSFIKKKEKIASIFFHQTRGNKQILFFNFFLIFVLLGSRLNNGGQKIV